MFTGQPLDDTGGVVDRSVVDHQQFPILIRLLEHAADPLFVSTALCTIMITVTLDSIQSWPIAPSSEPSRWPSLHERTGAPPDRPRPAAPVRTPAGDRTSPHEALRFRHDPAGQLACQRVPALPGALRGRRLDRPHRPIESLPVGLDADEGHHADEAPTGSDRRCSVAS